MRNLFRKPRGLNKRGPAVFYFFKSLIRDNLTILQDESPALQKKICRLKLVD